MTVTYVMLHIKQYSIINKNQLSDLALTRCYTPYCTFMPSRAVRRACARRTSYMRAPYAVHARAERRACTRRMLRDDSGALSYRKSYAMVATKF